MNIIEVFGSLDTERYNEFVVVGMDTPLVKWNDDIDSWDTKTKNDLDNYYEEDPDEEDNNKTWVRYEYEGIVLYIVRDTGFERGIDITSYYILGITQANKLYDVFVSLELVDQYELIRYILAIIIEHVLANSNGSKVF